MITLTNPLIESILSVPKKAAITNTKLRGGTTVNNIKINYSIAEAIMTLNGIEEFGKADVDVPDLFLEENIEGYSLKTGGLELFAEYDREEQKVVQLFLNRTEKEIQEAIASKYEDGEIKPYHILQAFVLIGVKEGLFSLDFDIKEVLQKLQNTTELAKEDALAEQFAQVINAVENFLNQATFREVNYASSPGEVEFERMEYKEEKDFFGFEKAAEVVVEVAETVEPIKQAEVVGDDDMNTQVAFDFETKNTAEEISFTEHPIEEPKAKANTKAKTSDVELTKEETKEIVEQTKKAIQAFQPVIQELSEEDVKKRRPLVWDDSQVRTYLRQFTFETYKPFDTKEEFIEAVILFRKEQREKNVPLHAMLQVEPKMIYVGDPEPIEVALKNMLVDVHTILKGPAGAGKTVIAQTLSAILNMPLYTMNGSSDSDTDVIVGSKEAANGATYGVDGRLIMAMKYAGIFYADEVNFVLPEILAVVNAALDHRKEIYNDATHEEVIGHRNFRFVGAMNVGYEGTRLLNKATANRSVSIQVDYMKPEYLKQYLASYDPGYTEFQKNVLKMNQVSEADIILIVNIAKKLQDAVKNPKIALEQEAASIRSVEQLLKMTRTMTFEKAIKALVHNFDEEETRISMVGVLKGVSRLNIKVEEIL